MVRFALAAGVAVACMAPASPAAAHAILLAGAPEPGGTVEAGPRPIELRYNSRIDRARSVLRLVGPDKAERALPISADGPPDVVRSAADLAPGSYVIRWQVLAVDGHVTRGEVRFTVRPRP